jgi:hypothetical protein
MSAVEVACSACSSTYRHSYDGDGLRRTKTWFGIAATYGYSLAEGLSLPIEENPGRFLRGIAPDSAVAERIAGSP